MDSFMNKYLYILMLLCLMFVGCTDEFGLMTNKDEDCIVLNIYNTSLTKAVDPLGEEYERKLNRLDCFFYAKGATNEPCIYYQKVENVNEVGVAEIPFYVDESLINSLFGEERSCEVFVIANLSTDIIGERNFAAEQEGTDVESLGQFMLRRDNPNYDAVDKPFVMAGLAECKKDSRNNAQATIPLVRAAAKVTFSVTIPQSITVIERTLGEGETYQEVERIMKPVITNESMTAALHNGARKGYIYGTYPGADPDDANDPDLYVTEKLRFNYVKTIPEVPATESNPVATPAKDLYSCELPLYTYARTWTKGDPNAAYWSFQMQWGYDSTGDGIIDTYHPYYYQILINGANRSFEPNHWYDLKVNVGVLGSTIEALPKVVEELSYYVFDWTRETLNGGSGDRLENVELQKYSYLEVPQRYIEMDNVSTTNIKYSASHKIGVKFDKKGNKSVYGLPGKTNLSALYISNSSGTPTAVEIRDIVMKNEETADADEANDVIENCNFVDNGNGTLTFNYTLNQKLVCSPAYLFITIWLDVNGDGVHDEEEEVITEDVTIVMYPAIYIIGDDSSNFSVFVNGNYNSQESTNNGNLKYCYIANEQVGKAFGYEQGNTQYMHVISVSSFNEDNYQFTMRNNNHAYIIGDPRSRSPYKFDVPDAGTDVQVRSSGWIKAKDVNGVERNLQYYYPTSIEADAYRIISPKFRISSKLAGYSHSSPEGAPYRCASYQEDGYPAGRWRLPTTAEVLFVINLQNDLRDDPQKIQELFVGSSNYCSATHTINNNNNQITIWDGIVLANNKETVSVRCVYDEWYWGSEQEALKNADYDQNGGYEFTWGDEKIW